MMKILPKTVAYIERMEELYEKANKDFEAVEKFQDEDKYIIMNPMLHLAEAICNDTDCFNSKKGMAIDLAKYIFLINGISDACINFKFD